MTQALRQAAKLQETAAGSAKLATKHRLALIEGKPTTFMGRERSEESMALIVMINDEFSAAYYAAARLKMGVC